MASVRDQILDALVARFSLAGWTVAKRSPINVLNVPKAAYVYDEGESGNTDAHIRYSMNMDVKVLVRVQVEDSSNAYVAVDEALVELQKVVHNDPQPEAQVTGWVSIAQTGHRKFDPDEGNTIAIEWSLTAKYIHNFKDPEAWTAIP